MSEDILSGLRGPEIKELVGSLWGPDLSALLKSEWVFTCFIKHLVGGSEATSVYRSRLLISADIIALYEELTRMVATINEAEGTQVARWVCNACQSFFNRARGGLRILSRSRPLPSLEARFEVFALVELASILGNYFANHAATGRVGGILCDEILQWAHRRYPNWGLALDGKRYGD